MTMRIHTLITHLQPEEAYTLIETLDQLRDALMRAYDKEITAMLNEASQTERTATTGDPF